MKVKGKVIRFNRGARRHPRWNLGTPPRRSRGLDPQRYLKLAILVAGLGLFVLPFGADSLAAVIMPKSETGCRVISVTDGDTVRLYCRGRGVERARLTGFDTPEIFSPGCASEYIAGQKAAWALRRLLFEGDTLSITRRGTDRYGRALISMSLDGVAVADTMTEAGHARRYSGGKRSDWCEAI